MVTILDDTNSHSFVGIKKTWVRDHGLPPPKMIPRIPLPDQPLEAYGRDARYYRSMRANVKKLEEAKKLDRLQSEANQLTAIQKKEQAEGVKAQLKSMEQLAPLIGPAPSEVSRQRPADFLSNHHFGVNGPGFLAITLRPVWMVCSLPTTPAFRPPNWLTWSSWSGDVNEESCDPESSAERLQGLRALMKAHQLDAYLVTSQDAHSSEYVCSADERRSFLTGFSGSAGSALVTAEQALLWTDSRYFLQAEKQLQGTEWLLMRQSQPGVPDFSDWALEHLKDKTLGVDPRFISFEQAEEWSAKWNSAVHLKEVTLNLVDAIWTTRPEDPCNPLEIQPLHLAGESVDSKLSRVREAIKEQKASCILLSALDQIAWLFNLRGSDIEYNPVFFAYAAVFQDSTLLFLRALDEGRPGVSEEVRTVLSQANVTLKAYSAFFSEMGAILKPDEKVFLEAHSSSLAVMSLVRPDLRVKGISPVEEFKACKNAVEIDGLKRACKRDSVALCQVLSSLEKQLANGASASLPNEVDVCEMITAFRRKLELYVGDSFDTISSVGSNTAVVHYKPEKATCKRLAKEEMYLIDTGGQYRDGTTDVTRTVHFGTPTEEQKRFYTRVLQGHLALATAIFPEGTCGLLLDAFARRPLWQDGMEYGHGTGHGIGAYLNVHEGPAQIGGGQVPGNKIQSSEGRRRILLMPLKAGFFVSDEPGCYKDGDFGIRIESDILATAADTPYKMSSQKFLKFDYLTLVPMCCKLVNVSLLSPFERQWVDSYHLRVWEELKEELSGDFRTWLWEATRPL
eukprot:s2_g8.t1